MDILVHALTGLILMKVLGFFSWYGIVFSVIPDFISYLPYFIHRFFIKRDFRYKGMKEYPTLGSFFDRLYKINHSLVFITLLFGVLYLLKIPLASYFWFWILHILLDIPTHGTEEDGGIKFLWPLSQFKIKSKHWSEKPFWLIIHLITWSLLFIVYFIF